MEGIGENPQFSDQQKSRRYMEYATKVVGSKLLVVLGHTSCGAVKGSIDDAKLGNLTELLAKIRPAVSASGPGSSKDDA